MGDKIRDVVPKKIRVYTRTGDQGTSSLYNGERRPKTDIVFEALGDTDELGAAVGLAREHCKLNVFILDGMLEEIQSRLMDVGSAIATPLHSSSEAKIQRTAFGGEHTEKLEKEIDCLDSGLPPLKNFILPSGGLTSRQLHVCRTICRRAERTICHLKEEGAVEDSVLVYMNRLSDYFFVAARYAAHEEGDTETIYQKPK